MELTRDTSKVIIEASRQANDGADTFDYMEVMEDCAHCGVPLIPRPMVCEVCNEHVHEGCHLECPEDEGDDDDGDYDDDFDD